MSLGSMSERSQRQQALDQLIQEANERISLSRASIALCQSKVNHCQSILADPSNPLYPTVRDAVSSIAAREIHLHNLICRNVRLIEGYQAELASVDLALNLMATSTEGMEIEMTLIRR